jgi:hypothetical protein
MLQRKVEATREPILDRAAPLWIPGPPPSLAVDPEKRLALSDGAFRQSGDAIERGFKNVFCMTLYNCGSALHHPPLAERFATAPEAPENPTPVEAMAHRLKTPAGRAVYALRKQIPEPVFGIIKSALGFRQFSLRGLNGARGEWSPVTMAWNIERIFALLPA